MTQFPQWYHVRRKSLADILTYLLLRRLLCLTDVHRGDTCSVVWHGSQLHTVFGTSPGQRHRGGGHVQLTLVPLAKVKPNNHWQQHVQYIKCLSVDYILNQEFAVKNTIRGLTPAGRQLYDHGHVTFDMEPGRFSELRTNKTTTSPGIHQG